MKKEVIPKGILRIFNRDGTITDVKPMKQWSPCSDKDCNHPSHKKKGKK